MHVASVVARPTIATRSVFVDVSPICRSRKNPDKYGAKLNLQNMFRKVLLFFPTKFYKFPSGIFPRSGTSSSIPQEGRLFGTFTMFRRMPERILSAAVEMQNSFVFYFK